MAWRPAGSLVKLKEQIDATYPNRSKVSDGMIGDTAHASTVSDHNPNADGVVTAFDITHDPVNGPDIDKLSDALATSRDGRIKYLIANGEILVPQDSGWVWARYEGVDPHTSHLHVSVYGDYDNKSEWNIGGKEEMVNEQDVIDIYNSTAGVQPSKDEIANYVASGKSYKTIQKEVYQWAIKNKIDYMTFKLSAKSSSDKAPTAVIDKPAVIDYLNKNLK
jgi:hypothetical protein